MRNTWQVWNITQNKCRTWKWFLLYTLYLTLCTLLGAQDVNQLVATGNRFIKEGKYNEATEVLFEAKRLDSQSPFPDIALGMMFLQKNDLWKAEMHLKTAESLSNDPSVQYMLALLYEKNGNKYDAINYWNKLSRNPNFKETAKKHLLFLGGAR
ncbi:MAG: hypothetical protein ABID79_00585 [Elusimicrobiota bacterium]